MNLQAYLTFLRQHLPQLIHPLAALVAVSADEGVHGQHVHAVVVAETASFFIPRSWRVSLYSMVAADEARQIEGLGGGVQGHSAQPASSDTDCRGMCRLTTEGQVRPDLVGDHRYIQPPGHVHGIAPAPPAPIHGPWVVGEQNTTARMSLRLILVSMSKKSMRHAVALQASGGW